MRTRSLSGASENDRRRTPRPKALSCYLRNTRAARASARAARRARAKTCLGACGTHRSRGCGHAPDRSVRLHPQKHGRRRRRLKSCEIHLERLQCRPTLTFCCMRSSSHKRNGIERDRAPAATETIRSMGKLVVVLSLPSEKEQNF